MVASPRMRIVRFILPAAVALLGVTSLLIAPRTPSEGTFCGRWMRLGPALGAPLNCDSLHFVRLARRPQLLLEPGEKRQSRPAYVLATSVMAWATWGGAEIVGFSVDMDRRYRLGIAALVAFNLAVISGAAMLMAGVLRRHGASLEWTLVVAAVLAVNDVTKAFAWTPHQQMLGILAPVAGLRVLDDLHHRRDFAPWRLAALLTGVAALAYGTFLALLAALGWARARQELQSGGRLVRASSQAAALLGFGLAPVLAWVAVVLLIAGAFYSHETEAYRQIIWVLDSAREGAWPLAIETRVRLFGFLRTFAGLEVAPFVLMALAGRWVAHRDGSSPPPIVPLALGLALFMAMFLYAVGLYQERLTFGVVPPLVAAAALSFSSAGEQLQSRAGRFVAGALVLGWIIFHVFKPGPYS